jgi:hypothetical protein
MPCCRSRGTSIPHTPQGDHFTTSPNLSVNVRAPLHLRWNPARFRKSCMLPKTSVAASSRLENWSCAGFLVLQHFCGNRCRIQDFQKCYPAGPVEYGFSCLCRQCRRPLHRASRCTRVATLMMPSASVHALLSALRRPLTMQVTIADATTKDLQAGCIPGGEQAVAMILTESTAQLRTRPEHVNTHTPPLASSAHTRYKRKPHALLVA